MRACSDFPASQRAAASFNGKSWSDSLITWKQFSLARVALKSELGASRLTTLRILSVRLPGFSKENWRVIKEADPSRQGEGGSDRPKTSFAHPSFYR